MLAEAGRTERLLEGAGGENTAVMRSGGAGTRTERSKHGEELMYGRCVGRREGNQN